MLLDGEGGSGEGGVGEGGVDNGAGGVVGAGDMCAVENNKSITLTITYWYLFLFQLIFPVACNFISVGTCQ